MKHDPAEGRDHEEVESIPWAMLSEQLGGGRLMPKPAMVVAVVVVMVATFAIVMWLRRPDGTVVPVEGDGPVAAASIESGESPTTPPPTTSLVGSSTTASPGGVVDAPRDGDPPEPALYTEADLMAVLPEQQMRLVSAHAESYVAAFFTADAVEAPPATVKSDPASLRPVVGSDGYSWVEWARTLAVEPGGSGGYRATVAFRTLTRSKGPLVRQPVRAVTVDVRPGEDQVVVVGPPRVAPPPEILVEPGLSPEVDVTPEIAALAIDAASGFGGDVEVIGGVPNGTGWDVTVMVGDGSGVTWPLLVAVPG